MPLRILVVLAIVTLGTGQRRYYSLEDMPDTNFDCRDKILGGYYADPETNCQMFHVCVKIPGQGVQDFRFLCPNETSFDQENQICADSGDIDCEASGLYLENFDLYRLGSAQANRPVPQFGNSKGTVVPLGPSTKSPILTNNVYEDDDFYLQKSESGDRRSHSKDILRGSSSSNFFNNRNKGKDLEDDEEDTPRRPETNQFRPRPNPPVRPKTQYQSQFRKTETSTTTTQPQVENANQVNDKKKTKVAVRKLARKRPSDELPEGRPTLQSQPPTFSSFTTQVTQKFAFGDQSGRYNTINRQQTTPSAPTSDVQRQQPQKLPQVQQPQPPQQPPQPQQAQQRFQNFRRPEQQTTLAFFEPSPTAGSFTETKLEGNKDTTPFSLLRNPIVAAGPNFQSNQNRGSTNYQQSRPTTAAANNQNFPSPTQNYQPQQNFNQQNAANFNQQSKQTTPEVPNFPQQRPNNGNFQQTRQQLPTNFQNQQTGSGNFQNQPAPNANFPLQQQQQQQQQQQRQQVNNFQNQQINNANFRQQPGNFQAPAGNFQNRQTTAPVRTPTQQTFNNQQNRQTTPQQPPRQFFNRDEFEDGDNQEFLKTAPSNNYRPSDLNSFTNINYKSENNSTRFSQPSTTKYYTPTIITTPKPTASYDVPTTLRQINNFYSTKGSTGQPSNYYTPTVSTTVRAQQPAISTTLQPSSSRLPQRIYPSPTPTKVGDTKDAAYDYAYYDDAGSFSEYDSIDSLGESDFSRTKILRMVDSSSFEEEDDERIDPHPHPPLTEHHEPMRSHSHRRQHHPVPSCPHTDAATNLEVPDYTILPTSVPPVSAISTDTLMSELILFLNLLVQVLH